jgi:5-methylcytosine-specific restriction endonuclease McrA
MKAPLPQHIRDQLDEWDRELKQLLAAGDPLPETLKARYRWPPLKERIVEETCDKCAYCESKVGHVYPGDVEHLLPKQHRPELRLEFENLTLACFECNNRKRSYYDPANPLIDPYRDDPDDHLIGVGPFVWHRPNDRKGELTERLLELNRKELIERRRERLDAIRRLVEKYEREPPGLLKQLIGRELLTEASACAEFSFVVREYLRIHCGIAA